jgi:hypothetical protein
MKHFSRLMAQVLVAAGVMSAGVALYAAQSGSAQAEETSGAVVELRPVKAELQGKLDAKSAKVGDSVTLKTEVALKTADGVEIPEGARLLGHVTEVQAYQKGGPDSHIGLLFDRAEWKGGQGVASRSTIEEVEPSQSMEAMAAAQGNGSSGAEQPGGVARVGGGGRMGGGAAGGAGARSTVGDAAGDATADAGSSVHAASGASGGVVAQATRIPGISLSSPATTSTAVSGTFYASKRNVRLDGGAQMTLGIAGGAAAN